MSKFWEGLHKVMGTKLWLSFSYHPQKNGRMERTIQSLKDLLRAYMVDLLSYSPLIVFTYNNKFHSNIGMTPLEALYGIICRTFVCWYESGESVMLGTKVVQQTMEMVKMIQENMRMPQSRKKSYHDKRRKALKF